MTLPVANKAFFFPTSRNSLTSLSTPQHSQTADISMSRFIRNKGLSQVEGIAEVFLAFVHPLPAFVPQEHR